MKINPTNDGALEAVLSQARMIRYGPQHEAAPGQTDEMAHDAVKRAIALRGMARAAERSGFLALPLDQYVARLAHSAEVELESILSPARGTDPSARLNPWIALASRLQLAAEHIRLGVRAWFAAEFLASLTTSFVRARGGSQAVGRPRAAIGVEETVSPEETAAELQRLESRYTASHRAELESVLDTLP
jgi:hypothetical protein